MQKIREIEKTEQNVRYAAVTTLLEIWACIDWEKMDKRRLVNIWDEFTAKVKASAMTTNSYELFVEKLARKMDVRSLRYSEINEFIHQSKEFKDDILKLLRDETITIVLEARLENQVRKEYAKRLQEKEEQEKQIEEFGEKQVEFTEKGAKVK